MNHRTFRDNFFLVIKGLAMGAANKIPGISGGVVAFVAGFYEEFIYSLQKINLKALSLLLNGRVKSFLNYINIKFLGYLIFGMLVSYFSVSKLLDYLLIHYDIYVWATFFGMILGSIYYIAVDFKFWNRKTVTMLLLGIAIGVGISFIKADVENRNLWFVLLCGIISVSGMVLPGLSGSFLLIMMGNYVLLLVDSVNALYDTITEVITLNFDAFSDPNRVEILQILLVFTLGSIAGLILFSQVLNYVLKYYRRLTTALIIGFISGSLGTVWPWKRTVYQSKNAISQVVTGNGEKVITDFDRYLPNLNDPSTWYAIFFILLGIFIILTLECYQKKSHITR